MQQQPPPQSLRWLEPDFIHRVYRTSAVLILLGAGAAWEFWGLPALAGWLLGALLGLGMLLGSEYAVRQVLVRKAGAGRLIGILMFKMLAAVGVLVLAFLGAQQGWLSLIALCLGFGLAQAVLVLKLVGQRLRAALGQEGGPGS